MADLSFGTDTSRWGPDGRPRLDLDGPEITGVRVLLEHCATTITTKRGDVFYDQTMGVSDPLQSLTNGVLTDSDLVRVAGQWGGACKDQVDGVTGARFFLKRSADGYSVSFTGIISTAAGAFPLNGLVGDALKVFFPVV